LTQQSELPAKMQGTLIAKQWWSLYMLKWKNFVLDKIKQFPFGNLEILTFLNPETSNSNTNKQVYWVVGNLFHLFARYKVQGGLWNKLNLNHPMFNFGTCLWYFWYRARLKQGGWSGIWLTLSKCEM
jgi:hypothetical protein